MDVKVKKRLLWAILFSTGFMVFLLSRVEWNHFRLIAGRLDIKYLIMAFGVFILGNIVRTFRFIRLDHTDKTPIHWWNINAFYNVVTSTLPGGMGEAASAYVIRRFSNLDLLAALRILLLSRLMDLFAMALLFFIAAVWMSSGTPYREAAAWVSGVLFLLSSLALMRSTEEMILKIIQKLPVRSNLKDCVYEKLSQLMEVSEEQRKKNAFGITLFLSVIMMITGVVSVYLLLRSFGVDFTSLQSMYCYGIYMVFQIIPVQGIAGIGTQAAWWALALNAAGYQAADAVALGFVLHGSFYVFIVLIGLTAMIIYFLERSPLKTK